MAVTTVSSKDFALDLAQAKRATTDGPVLVLDDEKPAYAVLKIEDYNRLAAKKSRSLLEVMDSIPGGDFEFEPPRMASTGFKPAEFD